MTTILNTLSQHELDSIANNAKSPKEELYPSIKGAPQKFKTTEISRNTCRICDQLHVRYDTKDFIKNSLEQCLEKANVCAQFAFNSSYQGLSLKNEDRDFKIFVKINDNTFEIPLNDKDHKYVAQEQRDLSFVIFKKLNDMARNEHSDLKYSGKYIQWFVQIQKC